MFVGIFLDQILNFPISINLKHKKNRKELTIKSLRFY
jgi:hypothetical protein